MDGSLCSGDRRKGTWRPQASLTTIFPSLSDSLQAMPPLTSSLLSRYAATPASTRVIAVATAALFNQAAFDWLDYAHDSNGGACRVELNRYTCITNDTTSSPSSAYSLLGTVASIAHGWSIYGGLLFHAWLL